MWYIWYKFLSWAFLILYYFYHLVERISYFVKFWIAVHIKFDSHISLWYLIDRIRKFTQRFCKENWIYKWNKQYHKHYCTDCKDNFSCYSFWSKLYILCRVAYDDCSRSFICNRIYYRHGKLHIFAKVVYILVLVIWKTLYNLCRYHGFSIFDIVSISYNF